MLEGFFVCQLDKELIKTSFSRSLEGRWNMTRKIKKEWESNRLNVAAFLCAIGLMFMPGCQGGQQLRSVQDRHLTLDQGLEALSMNLVSSLPQDRKLLVAVLDFNDLAGCVSAFGRLVGEELITQLFQTKRVQVVERSQLDKALNELEFNLSGAVDPEQAKRLGKHVGADAILTGTVTDLERSMKINARLIEVERGNILAAAGAEVTKDRAVARLAGQSLRCPSASSPITAAVHTSTGHSKRIGDITITLKRINVSKKEMTAILDFFNHTDAELQIGSTGRSGGNASLTDDKGNNFALKHSFSGWYNYVWGMWFDQPAILKTNSNTEAIFSFYNDVELKKVGSSFSFALPYMIYDTKTEKYGASGVSFTDIGVQVPK